MTHPCALGMLACGGEPERTDFLSSSVEPGVLDVLFKKD